MYQDIYHIFLDIKKKTFKFDNDNFVIQKIIIINDNSFYLASV